MRGRFWRGLLVVLVLVVLFLPTTVALAQDGAGDTGEPVENLLTSLWQFIESGPSIIGWTGLAVFFAYVVQALKMYAPFARDWPARYVNLGVQLVVWGLYAAALYFQQGEQFRTLVDTITPFLGALVSAGLGGIATAGAYSAGKQLKFPGLASRPE